MKSLRTEVAMQKINFISIKHSQTLLWMQNPGHGWPYSQEGPSSTLNTQPETLQSKKRANKTTGAPMKRTEAFDASLDTDAPQGTPGTEPRDQMIHVLFLYFTHSILLTTHWVVNCNQNTMLCVLKTHWGITEQTNDHRCYHEQEKVSMVKMRTTESVIKIRMGWKRGSKTLFPLKSCVWESKASWHRRNRSLCKLNPWVCTDSAQKHRRWIFRC